MWQPPPTSWLVSCGELSQLSVPVHRVRLNTLPSRATVVILRVACIAICRQGEDAVASARVCARDAALSWDLTAFRGKLVDLLRATSATAPDGAV